MQPQVRVATLDDAPLIVTLTHIAWAGKVAADSGAHRETLQRVVDDLTAGGGFVLMLDGVAIGSGRYAPLADRPEIWEVMRVGVVPPWRGRGWATQIMAAILDAAVQRRVRELRLAVRADQPRLLDYYAGFGFVPAPGVAYTHANPDSPPPYVMRRSMDVF